MKKIIDILICKIIGHTWWILQESTAHSLRYTDKLFDCGCSRCGKLAIKTSKSIKRNDNIRLFLHRLPCLLFGHRWESDIMRGWADYPDIKLSECTRCHKSKKKELKKKIVL